MMMLQGLSQDRLQLIRSALEKFFYKARFNIAFYDASRSEEYRNFRSAVDSAIEKQILRYAKVEKIRRIIKVEKAAKTLTDDKILDKVSESWEPIQDFISDDQMDEFYHWVGEHGGQTALRKLDILGTAFVLTSAVLIAELVARRKFLAETVDKTTKEWIARTIEEGISRGLNETDIAMMLRNQARSAAEVRADKIAETETMWGMNLAELTTYKKNKVLEKMWVTAHDEKVCEICWGNEGAGWLKVEEEFPSGNLHPLAHIMCRCMLKVKVPEKIVKPWTGD